MKSSEYNLFLPLEGDRTIIFNSNTKRFFVSSNNSIANYREVINSPNLYTENQQYQKLLATLSKNGFVIDDNINELSEIEKLYLKNKRSKEYSLIIMTTYACNFACWYCVQDHENIYLGADTEQKIIEHIKRYLISNSIEVFSISWFGGEPLLNFKAICSISEFAKKFCEEQNIKFSCSITTNGVLLSPMIINRMKQLNFISFQITIDGAKQSHNLTKYNKVINDSFSLILNNIVALVSAMPDSLLTLRINYTHKNLTTSLVDDIDNILNSVRNRIFIIFRKVWQEPQDNSLFNAVSLCTHEFIKRGYTVNNDYDFIDFLSCYVEREHYMSIFPNGAVDRCNNKDIKKARGYLSNNGDVVWNSTPQELLLTVFSNNSECRLCKYLPLCMGPCPAKREGLSKDDALRCNVKNRDEFFNKTVIDYCLIKSNYRL